MYVCVCVCICACVCICVCVCEYTRAHDCSGRFAIGTLADPACVCACVCERERQRERVGESCVCVRVIVRAFGLESAGLSTPPVCVRASWYVCVF